ncbi:MAG: hypothetical protein NVS9B7_07460 [Flavisolibacter sp.]
MMINLRVSIALIVLLYFNSLQAQKLYSLPDVLKKTLDKYPSLVSKGNAIKQQVLRRHLINTEQLPEISFQGQQSYGTFQTISGSFFPLPGIYNTSGMEKNIGQTSNAVFNLYNSAVLEWNFLQFGRVKSKLAQADAAVQVGTKALLMEQLRLNIASTRAYFAVLESEDLLSKARADMDRLKELLDVTESQASAGLRPAADTLLLKSTFLRARGAFYDQQGFFETSMIELGSLIGEEPDSFKVDKKLYDNINSKEHFLSLDSLQNNPYLNYLKSEISYANETLKYVKRLAYPSVGLLAGAGIRGTGFDRNGLASRNILAPLQNMSSNYLAGIGITWKLSSLYQNKIKQNDAGLAIESAKADYEAAAIQLKSFYTAALRRSQFQRQKVLDAKIALQSSRQAYDLYVVRYNTGLINLIELLQIQKTLQEEEVNYSKSLGYYWIELINQSESMGNLSLLSSHINQ